MEKRFMTFLACLFLSIGMALAQTQVTGTVTSSEDGMPIVGASVRVVGTKTGTVTDIDGNFALTVPADAKVEVSYIGMRPTIVKASARMNVKLTPDDKTLDEVMVVAYGTTKKYSFTGSASALKDTDMSAEKGSLVKSLEGKMAGVRVGAAMGDPGADQNILIRGISSVNGSTQPLYVVDGVPVLSSSDGYMSSSGVHSQSMLATLNPNGMGCKP